jgi:hypothetical protein
MSKLKTRFVKNNLKRRGFGVALNEKEKHWSLWKQIEISPHVQSTRLQPYELISTTIALIFCLRFKSLLILPISNNPIYYKIKFKHKHNNNNNNMSK